VTGRGELLERWRRARNVLAIRLDNIGDVVMTGPALAAVKAGLPSARLTLMASPGGAQAAPLLPAVDEVLSWRVLWQDVSGALPLDPGREQDLVDELRRRRFDAAVVFTSFSQTPHAAAYVCYLAGIPLRLGQSKEQGGAVLTTELAAPPDGTHQVERNLRLVEAVGLVPPSRDLRLRVPDGAGQRAREALRARGVPPGGDFLLLNPWTSCQARTYPPDRSATATRRLADATGLPVVVTGADRDRPAARALAAAVGPAALDLVGETSVPELAALVAGAALVLTNNTAVMHLADATGTPMVVTFAGTERESEWGPRSAPAALLRRETWCSPCRRFTCPYQLECLDLAPQQVVDAALALLDLSSPATGTRAGAGT
jgi:ADP-heptose:LPS heptosyltransferase